MIRRSFRIPSLLLALAASLPTTLAEGQRSTAAKPNVVLMFADNVGWGEIGAYGSVRGVPTPSIDSIAAQGIRLDNFNVEFSCTVSRAALMTGRYAVRAGAAQPTGITLWETTLAEGLKSVGYQTALFGKWHLGGATWIRNRTPIDQGFDEWYGIPNTSNEALWVTNPSLAPKPNDSSFVWEQRAGTAPRRVKLFDLPARALVDREAAQKSIEFMGRSVKARRPFFVYYPMTQAHFPAVAHPDFAGKTGAGDVGDAMADIDYNVGLVLAALKQLGVDRNTIVLWCTDNGPEARRPWRGTSGPWRGFYNTVMEGGIRTPCVIRWPGRIPRGRTSNALVSEMDLFPTIAAAVGAPEIVPTDRPIDGQNILPFLEGKRADSGRESLLFFTGSQVRAVKWKDWKFHYAFMPEPRVTEPPLMRLFNLRADPREDSDVKDVNPWAIGLFDGLVAGFAASAAQFPNVPTGVADPYVPPRRP
ncbi:MAG: sulfatase-like hydrolase/transferase [Gemmatimonadaceae bacterium]|nr:sulfatase-like hydrolase/transferase [Gemmatimonadaceae bacterium]MCC6430510.1 sulfatase-like hydrolase/transferase [Gemmatimonadaceae bacterium]